MKRIVSHNKYSEYICSLKDVSNVEVLETGDVKFELKIKDEIYSILFFSLSDHKLPVVFLCNPEHGGARKPHHLYLKKHELIHLCLSVRDDVSVRNYDYKGILEYAIKRVVRLLTLDKNEEKREFRKEFLYFWNQASNNSDKVKIFVESSNRLRKLVFYEKKKKLEAIESTLELNQSHFKDYKATDFEGYYIPIINSGGILPPFKEQPWDLDALKYILYQCISESNVELLEKVMFTSKRIFFAFEMNLPDTIPITFLLKLEFRNKRKDNIFDRLKDVSVIEHWSSQRCDTGYLFKRIGVDINNFNKKVLVVGAGSLGSYILSELPKLGVHNITIFDNDKLSVENLMRHKLGSLYANINKAFGMKYELQTSFPQLRVEYKDEKFIEDNIISYNLDQYDLIIITTGGTDFMLNLNRKLKGHLIKVPVLSAWIEANGIGVHSILVDYNKKGCFQCLYTDSDNNKAHYGHGTNKYSFVGTGCGSVFNSYGNLTLLKGSTMILEVIQMQLYDSLNNEKNLLYSVRTTNFHNKRNIIISKRDFDTSNDFYISERCEVCGTQV